MAFTGEILFAHREVAPLCRKRNEQLISAKPNGKTKRKRVNTPAFTVCGVCACVCAIAASTFNARTRCAIARIVNILCH